jgi:serine protease
MERKIWAGLYRALRPLMVILLVAAVLAAGCTRARPSGRSTTPSPSQMTTSPVTMSTDIAVVPLETIGDKPDIVPGEVVIRLETAPAFEALEARRGRDGVMATGIDGIDQLNRQFGVTSFDPVIKPVAQAVGESVDSMAVREPAMLGLYVATLGPQVDVNQAISAYAAQPEVVYAEPNYYVYAADVPAAPLTFTPDDPYFSLQWNLNAIQAPRAWDVSDGENVVVAVLDSGIAYEDYQQYRQAPDLQETRFIAGYDFVNNDAHPNDDGGHGSHVAGTIAQSTNNAVGVAGVAYNATLMPVKVLNARGQGSFDALAQGIIFAADHGARVINMSLSGRKTSQLLVDAINYATDKGVLIVAAAGNSGGAVEYPAAYDRVLAVGSVEFQQQRAQYSNYGPQVSVVAPGGDTHADINGDGYPDGVLQQTFTPGDYSTFQLKYMEGTSMAAPHVAGVAALLFAFNPGASADQVRQAIESTAMDLGAPGRDDDYGYGLVQAAAALQSLGAGLEPTPTPTQPQPLPTSTMTPTPSPIPPVTEEITPTPTVTLTPPPVTAVPTVTTAPPTVGEAIVNGGFETDGGWSFGVTQIPGDYSTTVAHSGVRSARLGIAQGYDIYGYSSVWQPVTIPAGITRATLTYWTYPVSSDMYPRDLQMVLLLDDRLFVIGQVEQSLSNVQQWIPGSYDLTPYAGRTVNIYFGVFNNGGTGRTTALYVDDVSVIIE